jgi:hypothetical protein
MGRSTLGEIARYLAIGAAVLIIAGLFLPFYGGGGGSLFEVYGRYDILVLVLAIAVISLAIVDRFVKWRGLLPIAGATGLFVLTEPVFTLVEFGPESGVGYWLYLIGALALTAAGLMALIDSLSAPRAATAAQPAPPAAATGAPPGPPVPPGSPQAMGTTPAAWMPDPWGQARLRYWNGREWTEATAP